MLSYALKRTVFGFCVGMAIGNIIFIILGYANTGTTVFVAEELAARMGGQLNAFALQTFLSGLYGAVCNGGAALYYYEKCPLSLATALHFGIVACVYSPIAFILNWVANFGELFIVLCVFAAVYLCIWLTMYAIYKAQVKELNVLQEQYIADNKSVA